MLEWTRKSFISFFGIVLCLYTIIFVNFSVLKPQSCMLFIMFGLVLCFLSIPAFKWINDPRDEKRIDGAPANASTSLIWNVDIALRWILAILTVICFVYVFVQTEPIFRQLWPNSAPFNEPTSLGDRVGD